MGANLPGVGPEKTKAKPSPGASAPAGYGQQVPYGQGQGRFGGMYDPGTVAPAGYSQQTPGVAEQAQQNNELYYGRPGEAERFYGQNQGYFGSPSQNEGMVNSAAAGVLSGPGAGHGAGMSLLSRGLGNAGAGNLMGQAYSSFQGNQPQFAQDPGLDPYYQNASRQALERINQNAAARGAYGSSAAMDMGNEAITNLAAEQANREADYNLRMLGERRAWEGLGGQMAGMASQDQLGWLNGLGNLGMGLDQSEVMRQTAGAGLANMGQGMELGRLGLGGQMAGQAQGMGLQRQGQAFGEAMGGQGMRDNRIQGYLDNMFRREALYAPLMMGWGQGVLGQNQGLLDSMLGGYGAAATDERNAEYRRGDQFRKDFDAATDFASSMGWMPGGG